MKLDGPMERKQRETLSGVHDLVISLEIYRLEKAVQEMREERMEKIRQAIEDHTDIGGFIPSVFMEQVGLERSIYAVEQRVNELIQTLIKKAYA